VVDEVSIQSWLPFSSLESRSRRYGNPLCPHGLSSAELSITRIAGAAVPGRVLELWLIAEGAAAPVSLGVMPDITPATLSVRKELRTLMIGGTLAISDEPLGGSLTGAPTGAVLATGKISLS
ncbi:MAG: anti-sigma-K factor RskA, partial [Paracoccaceae bacterium]